jgi:hypothetical protein
MAADAGDAAVAGDGALESNLDGASDAIGGDHE